MAIMPDHLLKDLETLLLPQNLFFIRDLKSQLVSGTQQPQNLTKKRKFV